MGEYGMSELSSQSYDHVVEAGGTRRFRFPPWARIQIISPETGLEAAAGEAGLIRVFDLANVYSVLAVQTEDLGISDAALAEEKEENSLREVAMLVGLLSLGIE